MQISLKLIVKGNTLFNGTWHNVGNDVVKKVFNIKSVWHLASISCQTYNFYFPLYVCRFISSFLHIDFISGNSRNY